MWNVVQGIELPAEFRATGDEDIEVRHGDLCWADVLDLIPQQLAALDCILLLYRTHFPKAGRRCPSCPMFYI